MKRFIRRCRLTWHSFWFRRHVDRQDFLKAAEHQKAMRKLYGWRRGVPIVTGNAEQDAFLHVTKLERENAVMREGLAAIESMDDMTAAKIARHYLNLPR